MQRLGPKGRAAITEAAHDAVRGRKVPEEQRIRAAEGLAKYRQESGFVIGRFEGLLQEMLEGCGCSVVPQQAVGFYNIDLAVGSVAVEVHVGANHPTTSSKIRHRLKQLRELNWSVLYVWITCAHPLTEAAADKIVTAMKFLEGNPTIGSQYWVIRGTGEDAVPRYNRYEVSFIPTPIPSLDV